MANDAADALEKAGAAHLTGAGTSDGKPMTVDLRLQDADAAGTITMDGGTLDLSSAGRLTVRP